MCRQIWREGSIFFKVSELRQLQCEEYYWESHSTDLRHCYMFLQGRENVTCENKLSRHLIIKCMNCRHCSNNNAASCKPPADKEWRKKSGSSCSSCYSLMKLSVIIFRTAQAVAINDGIYPSLHHHACKPIEVDEEVYDSWHMFQISFWIRYWSLPSSLWMLIKSWSFIVKRRNYKYKHNGILLWCRNDEWCCCRIKVNSLFILFYETRRCMNKQKDSIWTL